MKRVRRLIAAVTLFLVFSAGPAYAHTCFHYTSLTRIGTSSQYYKWYSDTTSGGHYTSIWSCGSNGCVWLYVHGHTDAKSACPGHIYGGPGPRKL